MKGIQKWCLLCAMTLSIFLWKGMAAEAADSSENVSVTVSTNIDIVFHEDGTNSASEFTISNQSLLPIEVKTVNVTEYNDWRLVSDNTLILVNTKQLVFQLGEQCLFAGENAVNFTVPDHSQQKLDIEIGRGAWTNPMTSEKAMQLEVDYEFGTKEFVLHLDGNGHSELISPLNVSNGETVNLPELERENYVFAGWQDEEGHVYTGEYTMPVGDITLTAIWKEIVAYAIYSADDSSFRFIQSADVVEAGDLYNGRTVTSVYTGFEENCYTTYSAVPWYADGTNLKVKSVVVEDVIKPISMQNWFYQFKYCTSFNVAKIDTGSTTSMYETFRYAGQLVSGTFKITGMADWDVSKVTNFSYMFDSVGVNATKVDIGNLGSWDVSNATTLVRMFYYIGYNATTLRIGDLSDWDTSNVTMISVMFMSAGMNADWHLDCSKWTVNKVKNYNMFNKNVETKVIAPKWVT